MLNIIEEMLIVLVWRLGKGGGGGYGGVKGSGVSIAGLNHIRGEHKMITTGRSSAYTYIHAYEWLQPQTIGWMSKIHSKL